VSPTAEERPVLLRRTEQLADDRDRVGTADVAYEVEADRFTGGRGADRGVQDVIDDRAPDGTEPGSRARGGRPAPQPAEALVLVAFRAQDARPALAREIALVGHAVQRREEPDRLVPAAVLQDRYAVVVVGEHVAEGRTGEPVRGPQAVEHGESVRMRGK